MPRTSESHRGLRIVTRFDDVVRGRLRRRLSQRGIVGSDGHGIDEDSVMRLQARKWLSTPGLNTRILLLVGTPLVITALITTLVVPASTRRFVEDAIGDQMVMQARIVAHLVAIAEQQRPAGMTPEEINPHL